MATAPYYIYGPDGHGPGHPKVTGVLGLQAVEIPGVAISTIFYDWDFIAIKLPDGEVGNHPHYRGHWVVRAADIDESSRLARLREIDKEMRSLMDEPGDGIIGPYEDGDF